MKFHRIELVFFIFVVALGLSGLALCYSLMHVKKILGHNLPFGIVEYLHHTYFGLIIATGLMFVAGILSVFYIYPRLRSQLREGGKLREMTKTLNTRSQNLERAALTDGLTGMNNRRYFDEALKQYLDEFRRIDKPIGLMVLDLDHFKKVNDTYGHDVGDEVLRSLAHCLAEFTRYHDVVARLGGEEFAVLAPNMSTNTLVQFADRIREEISKLDITSGNVHLRVTTSLGLAVWDGIESADEFYRRADMMLYEAKRGGRNRVCAA